MQTSDQVPTSSKEYFVVFEYLKSAEGYAGIRTQSSFKSRAKFDEEFAAHGRVLDGKKIIGEEMVVAEGVTQAEALELIRAVPLRNYVRAAIDEATDPLTGRINRDIANMHAANAMVARRFLGPPYQF